MPEPAYAADLEDIRNAPSHQAILDIARRHSASALHPDQQSLLYSGPAISVLVDGGRRDIASQRIALDIASHSSLNIIDETPRGQFLADANVADAIRVRARQLSISAGLPPRAADLQANNFMFGSFAVPEAQLGSLHRSAWGQASADYVHSLQGALTVVANQAPSERMLARVEIPLALGNAAITAISGHSTAELVRMNTLGGPGYVLDRVQERFRQVVNDGGVYVAPDGRSVHLTREAAGRLGIADAGLFPTAGDLQGAGMVKGSTPAAGAAPTMKNRLANWRAQRAAEASEPQEAVNNARNAISERVNRPGSATDPDNTPRP
ncbi:hypothetical protein [Endobacter medicaginis]